MLSGLLGTIRGLDILRYCFYAWFESHILKILEQIFLLPFVVDASENGTGARCIND